LDEGLDSCSGEVGILVLPDPHDIPSSLTQLSIRVLVSAPIRFDLLAPEIFIAGGPGRVLGAAMPKAAVDENRHPRGGKGNVSAATFVGEDRGVHSISQTPRM
jgi:hypothetical protein